MQHVIEAFREGGWFMYPLVALALVALVASFVALGTALTTRTRQPALVIAIAAMVLGLLVPLTGAVGYAMAMRTVFGVVESVDPASRAQVMAQGISEAMNLIVFGAVCGVVPCFFALAAALRAALRPKG